MNLALAHTFIQHSAHSNREGESSHNGYVAWLHRFESATSAKLICRINLFEAMLATQRGVTRHIARRPRIVRWALRLCGSWTHTRQQRRRQLEDVRRTNEVIMTCPRQQSLHTVLGTTNLRRHRTTMQEWEHVHGLWMRRSQHCTLDSRGRLMQRHRRAAGGQAFSRSCRVQESRGRWECLLSPCSLELWTIW